MAVGTGDAELPLRLKPECGKAQGHHSKTIIKPFSSSGSGRFKITTMEQCNELKAGDLQTAPASLLPQAAVIPLVFCLSIANTLILLLSKFF